MFSSLMNVFLLVIAAACSTSKYSLKPWERTRLFHFCSADAYYFTLITIHYVYYAVFSWLMQALDIVKQAKVASILGEGDRRKSGAGKEKPSCRGSRESLDMSYDGEEVSSNNGNFVCIPVVLR